MQNIRIHGTISYGLSWAAVRAITEGKIYEASTAGSSPVNYSVSVPYRNMFGPQFIRLEVTTEKGPRSKELFLGAGSDYEQNFYL
jgi:hypothetical protein